MSDFSDIIEHNKYALMGQGEFQAILEEMEKVHPKVILEIGTRQGYSSRAFFEAFNPDLLITVDILSHEEMPGGMGGRVNDERVKYLVADSTDHFTPALIAHALEGNVVDALFIDGSHMENDVKVDFHNYRPFVRPGGLIIMHDVVEHREDLEVWKVWPELAAPYLHKVVRPDEKWAGVGFIYV